MPKLKGYESQVAASGRGVSSGVDVGSVAAPHRAAQQAIGAAVGFAGELNQLEQRNAQAEISDLNAKFAEAREEWQARIQDDTRKGSIDTEKIKSDYTEFVNKMNGGIETTAGRTFFERQASRIGGQVLRTAGRAQVELAGKKAEDNWRAALDKNGSSLQSDPSGFQDIYGSTIEAIDAQVQVGAIPAAFSDKFKRETGKELAKNSLRGWAKMNPALAQEKLDSGEFDQFLDGDSRSAAQGYINQQTAAKEIEERRSIAAKEKAQKAASEAWQQKALPELAKGSLSTQSILDSSMDATEKIRWLKLADEATKESVSDPRTKNELTRRVLLPDDDPKKIRSIADLAPYVGQGISIQDAEQINGFIQKLPEGENLKDNRKRLMDFAEAKLVRKDPMTGVSDPDGEYNMSQYVVALQQEEVRMRKEGKNPALLYDPTSKEYFGAQVNKYQLTPQQIFAKMAERMTRSAIDGAEQEMITVVDKDGKKFKAPKQNLKKLLENGYREY